MEKKVRALWCWQYSRGTPPSKRQTCQTLPCVSSPPSSLADRATYPKLKSKRHLAYASPKLLCLASCNTPLTPTLASPSLQPKYRPLTALIVSDLNSQLQQQCSKFTPFRRLMHVCFSPSASDARATFPHGFRHGCFPFPCVCIAYTSYAAG